MGESHVVRIVEGAGEWHGPAYQACCSCGFNGDPHGIRSNAEWQLRRHELLHQYPPLDRSGRGPEAYYRALADLGRDWLASVLPDAAVSGERLNLSEVVW